MFYLGVKSSIPRIIFEYLVRGVSYKRFSSHMEIDLSLEEAKDVIKMLEKSDISRDIIESFKKYIKKGETVLFPTGVPDVDRIIMRLLRDEELLQSCKLNRYAADLCRDESFWRNRIIENFGADVKGYVPKGMTYKEVYLGLFGVNKNSDNSESLEEEIYHENIVYYAVKYGLFPLMKRNVLPKKKENEALAFAAKKGFLKYETFSKLGLDIYYLYYGGILEKLLRNYGEEMSFLPKIITDNMELKIFMDAINKSTISSKRITQIINDLDLKTKNISENEFIYFLGNLNKLSPDDLKNILDANNISLFQYLNIFDDNFSFKSLKELVRYFTFEELTLIVEKGLFRDLAKKYLKINGEFPLRFLRKELDRNLIDAASLAYIYKNSHHNEEDTQHYLEKITNLLIKDEFGEKESSSSDSLRKRSKKGTVNHR